MNGLGAVLPGDPRIAVPLLAAGLAGLVLVALWGFRLLQPPTADGAAERTATREVAARAFLALGVAYLLASPYVLPWYDALGWAPRWTARCCSDR
jgi:hypothetical protein